jgi:hypothetical protein
MDSPPFKLVAVHILNSSSGIIDPSHEIWEYAFNMLKINKKDKRINLFNAIHQIADSKFSKFSKMHLLLISNAIPPTRLLFHIFASLFAAFRYELLSKRKILK